MTWSNSTTVRDESFHERTSDPWWNESSFTSFRIPERQLMGNLYFYFRPNQNTAMGGPWFFDGSGDQLSTCLYNGWDWNMPIPDGADMFDFELESSFTVRTLEPQHSYRYTYQSGGCTFDLTFTADRPPSTMVSSTGRMNPGMVGMLEENDECPTGHYDQTGVMNGSLVIEGDEITVRDAAVILDRSWGSRKMLIPQGIPRGGYLFARQDRDNSFQAQFVAKNSWTDDPVIGAVDDVVSGFYVKDGIVGRLVSGERRVVSRGNYGEPNSEVIEAVDEHGRALHAQSTLASLLRLPGLYGSVMVFWAYADWIFDGHTAPGEVQEWVMCRAYRRWMQPGALTKATPT